MNCSYRTSVTHSRLHIDLMTIVPFQSYPNDCNHLYSRHITHFGDHVKSAAHKDFCETSAYLHSALTIKEIRSRDFWKIFLKFVISNWQDDFPSGSLAHFIAQKFGQGWQPGYFDDFFIDRSRSEALHIGKSSYIRLASTAC